MRPSWDHYFMEIAKVVAMRSTCNRKQVGVVLTRNHFILATGYGGSVRGQPHCIDVGCDIDPNTGGCVRTVHAETNAVAQAAQHGVSTLGATAYVTLSPCPTCFKLLVNAGIICIVYAEEYRVAPDKTLAQKCGVKMVWLDPAG